MHTNRIFTGRCCLEDKGHLTSVSYAQSVGIVQLLIVSYPSDRAFTMYSFGAVSKCPVIKYSFLDKNCTDIAEQASAFAMSHPFLAMKCTKGHLRRYIGGATEWTCHSSGLGPIAITVEVFHWYRSSVTDPLNGHLLLKNRNGSLIIGHLSSTYSTNKSQLCSCLLNKLAAKLVSHSGATMVKLLDWISSL